MKKSRLLSWFVISLLLFTGYALATPETDEIAESLGLLENIAAGIDDLIPDAVPASQPQTQDEIHLELSDNTPEAFQLLQLESDEEDPDSFFGSIFTFFNSPLPLPEQDDNHGTLSSRSHGIPEPMTFDMVRPLGAKKGELEVNTLFLGRWRNGKFTNNWAPEIEYAFRDGMAVEFELPMQSLKTEAIKAAFQATLPSRSDRFIHGFQFFNEYGLNNRHLGMTAIHIAGFRITEKLSIVSMNGAHNANLLKKPELAAITNHTLFYHVSDQLTLGVETNFFLRAKESTFLFLPQLHLELNPRYSLQIGAGFQREPDNTYAPVVGMRVVRTF